MYKALILRSVQGDQFYDTPEGEESLTHHTVEQAADHLLNTHKVIPNAAHGIITTLEGNMVMHV